MRKAIDVWVPFVIFGPLIWLSSVGYWTHRAYRGGLILAALVWFAVMLWDPKRE